MSVQSRAGLFRRARIPAESPGGGIPLPRPRSWSISRRICSCTPRYLARCTGVRNLPSSRCSASVRFDPLPVDLELVREELVDLCRTGGARRGELRPGARDESSSRVRSRSTTLKIKALVDVGKLPHAVIGQAKLRLEQVGQARSESSAPSAADSWRTGPPDVGVQLGIAALGRTSHERRSTSAAVSMRT
jgi:hypothetical protein